MHFLCRQNIQWSKNLLHYVDRMEIIALLTSPTHFYSTWEYLRSSDRLVACLASLKIGFWES